MKKEYGGGSKEFVYGEADCFEGVEETTTFLTSHERQSIVKHMLFNLRAMDGDHIGKQKFLEGQALGEGFYIDVFHVITIVEGS